MVESITPAQSFAALAADPQAQLIDVRTDAEWQYVGLPDLRGIGKKLFLISWQFFPDGRLNEDFVGGLRRAGLTPEQNLHFICRSGVRSLAAAQAAREGGFLHVVNVADGFEGNVDGAGHRGTREGWKAAGLAWRQ